MSKMSCLCLLLIASLFLPCFAKSPSQQEISDAERFNQALTGYVGGDCSHVKTDFGTAPATDNASKSPWLAAGMDLVLPGTGRIYNESYIIGGILMAAGISALTVTQFKIKDDNPSLYPLMIGTVLAVHATVSVDTFLWTKKRNRSAVRQ